MSFFVLVSLLFAVFSVIKSDDTPIIGILTSICMNLDHTRDNCTDPTTNLTYPEYLMASYAEYVKTGGGRVVPLFVDDSTSVTQDLLTKINGVILPGGSAPFDDSEPYWSKVSLILDYSRDFAQKNPNQTLPVFGICLGFEAMTVYTSQKGKPVMEEYNAHMTPLTVQPTAYSQNSKLFGNNYFGMTNYPQNTLNLITNNNINFNDHSKGFSPDIFELDEYLNGNFTVLGYCYEPNFFERPFVSIIEDKLGLNWYGLGYHPTKISFCPTCKNVPHDTNAIYANLYYGQFFIQVCRDANKQSMSDSEYDKISINNYNPSFTSQQWTTQTYYFND